MSQEMRWACWQLYYSGLRRAELWTAKIQGGCYVNATSKNGKPRITPIILPLRKIVGTPNMKKDALSKRFKAAAVQAGLGHYRLHDLRHGQASLLINAGAPLNVVAEALGHDDLKSTRRYAHLQTEVKAAWMNFAATGRQVTEKYGLPAGRRPATYKKKAA
jgi:integrase